MWEKKSLTKVPHKSHTDARYVRFVGNWRRYWRQTYSINSTQTATTLNSIFLLPSNLQHEMAKIAINKRWDENRWTKSIWSVLCVCINGNQLERIWREKKITLLLADFFFFVFNTICHLFVHTQIIFIIGNCEKKPLTHAYTHSIYLPAIDEPTVTHHLPI